MAKNNVIAFMDEPDSDHEIIALTVKLCDALLAKIETIRTKLDATEQECLRRLEQYVPTDRLLTSDEAATYLGFTTRWLQGKTSGRKPEIPCITIGTDKRFRKSSLDAWLAERESKPKKIRP